MSCKIITVNDLEELKSIIAPNYWNFRGQAQDWPLKTSIEVLLDECKLDYYWYYDEDTNFRHEFMENFRSANSSIVKGKLKPLALMQHYGLKTELLDVTEDFNIALHFASEKDFEEDGVIWGFNLAQLYKCHIENDIVLNVNKASTSETRTEYSRKTLHPKFTQGNFVIPLNLHEYQMIDNLRVRRQKGRFLYVPNFHLSGCLWQDNLFCGFEKALYNSYRIDKTAFIECSVNDIKYEALNGDKLIKLIIPKTIKKECTNYLKNLEPSITHEYLFPVDTKEIEIRNSCQEILQKFKNREMQCVNF